MGHVVISNCTWRNASVCLQYDRSLAVRVYNLTLLGGSVVVEPIINTNTYGSLLHVEATTALGCDDCFTVQSSKGVYGFTLELSRCLLVATKSAASIQSPVVTDSTIALRNSNVTVGENGVVAHAGTVSLPTSTYNSLSFTIRNVTLLASDSQLTSRSAQSAACLSVVVPNHHVSFDASDVTITCVSSTVQSTGETCIASAGLAVTARYNGGSDPASSLTSVKGVAISVTDSTVSASGKEAVASAGIALFGLTWWAGSSTLCPFGVMISLALSVTELRVRVVRSNCAASGMFAVTSTGIASYCSGVCRNDASSCCTVTSPSSMTIYNMSLAVSRSNIRADGQYAVSTLGCSNHGRTAAMLLSDAHFRSDDFSDVGANGTEAISSMGFALYAIEKVELDVSRVLLEAFNAVTNASATRCGAALAVAAEGGVGTALSHFSCALFSAISSTVTTSGTSTVAAAGVVVQSGQQLDLDVDGCVFQVNHTALRATSTGSCVVSAGVCACSSSVVTVHASDVSVAAETGDMVVSGTAASVAIGLGFVGEEVHVDVKNFAASVACSDVMCRGRSAVACVGVASSGGNSIAASGISSLTFANVTLLVSDSAVDARGNESVASVGFTSYSISTQKSAVVTTTSNIALYQGTLSVENSFVRSSGKEAVAAMGIASFSCSEIAQYGSTGCHSPQAISTANISNLDVIGNNASVAAEGKFAISSVGVSSLARGVCLDSQECCHALNASNVSLTNSTFLVVQANVSALGIVATVSMAFSSLIVPPSVLVVACFSNVTCGSLSSADEEPDPCLCFLGTTPKKSLASKAVIAVLSSHVQAYSGHCASFVPDDTGKNVRTSVLRDSTFSCSDVGWGGPCDGCCGSNIIVNGVSQAETSAFPGLTLGQADCPYNDTASACAQFLQPYLPIMAPLRIQCARESAREVTRAPSVSLTTPVTTSKSTVTVTPCNSSASERPSFSRSSSSSVFAASWSVTPPQERGRKADVGVAFLLPSNAARAIVETSAVTSAVAASYSSATNAAIVTRLALVVQAVDCRYNDEAVDPSIVQYPVPYYPEAWSAPERHTFGCLVYAFLHLVVVLCQLRFRRAVKFLSAVEAVAGQFYVPSVVGAVVFVLFHAEAVTPKAVCVACLLAESAVLSHRAYVVICRVPRECLCYAESSRSIISHATSQKRRWQSGSVVTQYGAFFDSTRSTLSSLPCRMAYFVELLCTATMAAAAAIKPQEGSCIGVAAAMCAASVFLLGYLVWFRPYEKRLDNSFSLGSTLMLVLQAVCAVVLTVHESSGARTALGIVTLAQCCSCVFQLLVVVGWRAALRARRAVQSQEMSARHNPIGEALLSLPSLREPC